jgi:hypothetical protein
MSIELMYIYTRRCSLSVPEQHGGGETLSGGSPQDTRQSARVKQRNHRMYLLQSPVLALRAIPKLQIMSMKLISDKPLISPLPFHPPTDTMRSLAVLLQRMGNTEEAKKLYEDSLSIMRELATAITGPRPDPNT